MPASLAELVFPGGITNLKCPRTGMDVIREDTGFDGEAPHSPHLRFFVDWLGSVWVADPADLPAEQAACQRELLAVFEQADECESQNELIQRCMEVLPPSALVLEILNPPAPSFDGNVCYACFDLGQPAKTPTLSLRELD